VLVLVTAGFRLNPLMSMLPWLSVIVTLVVSSVLLVFFFDHLKEITIKKAFAGESTEGILEAKNTIQNAFKQLEDTYGTTQQTQATNVSE